MVILSICKKEPHPCHKKAPKATNPSSPAWSTPTASRAGGGTGWTNQSRAGPHAGCGSAPTIRQWHRAHPVFVELLAHPLVVDLAIGPDLHAIACFAMAQLYFST